MPKWWLSIPYKGVHVVDTPELNDDFDPPSALLRPDEEVLTPSETTDTVLSDPEKRRIMIKVTRYQPEDEDYSYWVNHEYITAIFPKDFGAAICLVAETLMVTETADAIVNRIYDYRLESSNHDNI